MTYQDFSELILNKLDWAWRELQPDDRDRLLDDIDRWRDQHDDPDEGNRE